jgi:SAM-dependent methyltransferase
MIKDFIKKALANKKCSICSSRVYNFKPISDEYLKNLQQKGFDIPVTNFETLNYQAYTCPVCGGNDRDRLVAYYLNGKLKNADVNFRILENAPSNALKNYLFKNKTVSYRTTDLFMEDVDDKLDIQNMDLYKNGYFDLIICSHVLEHISNDKQALKELYRILKNNGECLLLVPIPLGNYEYDEDLGELTKEQREKRFGQDDHLRLYTKKTFEKRISEAGFKLKTFKGSEMSSADLKKYGIADSSVLYIGYK